MESEIDEMTASCKKQFLQHVERGGSPLPIGFVFADIPDQHDDSAVLIITMSRHIQSLVDLEDLAEHVRACSDDQAIAAGVIFHMRRQAWSLLQKEQYTPGTPDGTSDFVGVAHVEHLMGGYQTWTLDLGNMSPSPDGWKLHSSGYKTALPNLLPPACYGTCGQA